MPLRALNQLRQNIQTLLLIRKEEQKTLAFAMGVHPTTINKFLKGTRELQLADLDKVADFFGIATYQLFQPGIAPLTERRSRIDRRSGKDRRIGHQMRIMRPLMSEIATLHTRRKGDGDAPVESFRHKLDALTARHAREYAALLSQAEARGQAASAGRPRPAVSRRARKARKSDSEPNAE